MSDVFLSPQGDYQGKEKGRLLGYEKTAFMNEQRAAWAYASSFWHFCSSLSVARMPSISLNLPPSYSMPT